MLHAQESAAQAPPESFIPPGREGLIEAMLGTGVALPPGCAFQGAAILRDSIRARYACNGDRTRIVLLLRHPAFAQPASKITAQFAIDAENAAAAAPLIAAVEASVRRQESLWRWDDSTPAPPNGTNPPPPTSPSPAAARAKRSSPVPWVAILALASWVLASWTSKKLALDGPPSNGPATDRRLAGLSLFATALALRIALGPWGPFHANGQAPGWILGAAWDSAYATALGPGFPEIFAVLARLAPSAPDFAIFAANAAISALAPALLHAIARDLGVDRWPALLLGALLVVDPIMLRVAATESYFPVIFTLALASRLLWVRATHHAVTSRPLSAAGLALAAALLCAQAARVHPFAWAEVALVPFVLTASPALTTLRQRFAAWLASAAITGLTLACTSFAWLRDVARILKDKSHDGPAHILSWDTLASPALALAALVLLAGLRSSRSRWLALLGFAELAVLALTWRIYGQNELQQQVFARAFLPMAALGIVASVPRSWLSPTWIRAACLVATVAIVPLSWSLVRARTTEHFEYRWVREWLQTLPSECDVVQVDRVGDRVLMLPQYAAPSRSPTHPAVIPVPEGPGQLDFLASTGCLFYVRSSLCSSVDGRAPCDAIEAGAALQPVARATFPASPTHPFQPYDRNAVEVVISKVEPR